MQGQHGVKKKVKTPFERVLERKDVAEEIKEELNLCEAIRRYLKPFETH
ncbi:MAG: hypothetical protein ACPLZA_01975 [Thermodesulfovibrio sp.]